MKKIIITILIVSLIFNICKSQNDTIYLEDNFIILNEIKFNQTISNLKNGKWIEYELDPTTSYSTISLGCGYNYHIYEEFKIEYRSLRPNEYFGIIYPISKHCDTIENVIYCEGKSLQIENKLAPEKYKITGKGNYLNDKKEGIWYYSHFNGVFKKEIHYKNGIPTNSYKVYRNDKSLLLEVKKINDIEWEVCKYSENGKLIDCLKYKLLEIEALY